MTDSLREYPALGRMAWGVTLLCTPNDGGMRWLTYQKTI